MCVVCVRRARGCVSMYVYECENNNKNNNTFKSYTALPGLLLSINPWDLEVPLHHG